MAEARQRLQWDQTVFSVVRLAEMWASKGFDAGKMFDSIHPMRERSHTRSRKG